MVVYSFLCEKIPFKEFTQVYQIFKYVISNHRPDLSIEIPKTMKKLIQRCLDQDPEKRPDFSTIVDELLTCLILISLILNKLISF